MFKLTHTLGNVIHSGSKHECELILKGLTTYGIRDDKFEIIEFKPPTHLSDKTRDELKEELAEARLQCSFGDGLERDYVWDGCLIVGVNEMSDSELIEEYEQCVDEDDELIIKAKLEFDIDQTLTEE